MTTINNYPLLSGDPSQVKHSPFKRSALLIMVLLLAACGSDDSAPTVDIAPAEETLLTGVFVDSAVEGIFYETATQSGTTNSLGEYNYLPGETVTFSIGAIVLGAAPASGVVTPLSIVPDAVSADNVQVNNIVRFLLSLDSDGDPDNGISISSDITTAAADTVVDFSVADLSVDPGVTALLDAFPAIILVDETTAQSHFNETLALLEAEQNTVWGNLQWGSGTWSSSTE
ncbi:MAG: hypothetical protein ACJAXH_002935 [Colwellia sp.]|jgi:hypothetical protein